MSSNINKKDWKTIVSTVDGNRNWEKKKQKELSHVIDLIDDNNLLAIKNYLKKGVVLNEPLKEHLMGKITPLSYAAYHNYIETVQLLLFFRANINYHYEKKDALNFALEGQANETVEFLLAHGAVVEPSFLLNYEPRIIKTTKEGYLSGVKNLLFHGSKPNYRDKDNKIALYYNLTKSPQTNDDHEIGRLLLQYGSIQDDLDGQGMSVDELLLAEEQKTLVENAKLKDEFDVEEEQPTVEQPKKRNKNKML